jgi:hypothetical protein
MGCLPLHGGNNSGRKVFMNERHNTSFYVGHSYRRQRSARFRSNVVSRHPSLPTVCILDRT